MPNFEDKIEEVVTFVIVGGSICMYVFELIAISEMTSSNIREICPSSNIWECMAGTLVVGHIASTLTDLSFGNNINYATFKDKTDSIRLCISTGFGIWEGVELWGHDCSTALASTLIYRLTLASFIFRVVLFAFMCINCCCDTPAGREYTPTVRELPHVDIEDPRI